MTTATRTRVPQRNITVSHSNGNGTPAPAAVAIEHAPPTAPRVTSADVKAYVEARVYAMLERAKAQPRPQIAEPLNWWDLFAFGPFQLGADLVPPLQIDDSPLLPHQVIRVGESAFIATVLILNPLPVNGSGIIPCNLLSTLQLPFIVDYHSCNLSTCEPAQATLNVRQGGDLIPGQCVYVDVLEFIAEEEGCVIETNICARILDCKGKTPSPSPFAGFASWAFDPDSDFLAGFLGLSPAGPGFFNKTPVRFMVYE